MKKEFITYEQALALKELGFDEPCMSSRDMNNGKGLIQIPLYQQVFRWFREKYNLQFFVEKYDENKWWIACGTVASRPIFKTYEEAELACLEKLIEMAHPNN